MSEAHDNERRDRTRKRRSEKRPLPFDVNSRGVAAVLIAALVCAAVFAVVRWNDISPSSAAGKVSFADSRKDEAAADLTGSTVLQQNFSCVDGGLMYVSDTAVVGLSHDCERLFSEKHSFTHPMLKTAGEYALSFNEGGSSFRIFADMHKIYEGTQGKSITDCDINESGTYCILSDQTGYLSSLSVYDKNNKFVYSYSFSDNYAVSAALSRSGDTIAVGTVNSTDGRLVSTVYLLDVRKQQPIKTFTYDDQIVYEVRAASDEHFAVITDALTSVIKSDGSREIPYSYSSQILTAYDVCYGSTVVLSLSKSDDGRNCTIVTLNSDGSELGSYSTDQQVISIDAEKDRSAILSYGRLVVCNAFGDAFGSCEVGTDAKSVLLPQNKTAYVLCVSGINKLSVK